jgi:5'-3' exonuclease
LVDGTYELFRHHFGMPPDVREKAKAGATRGVVNSMLTLLSEGATHVGVATDHVIESFRNDLWPGYKSSAGVPEELLVQFPLVEEALTALGVAVWAMVDLEADDGLASAAAVAADDERVVQAVICTPDKDLGQCVVGDRVVQLDRRKDVVFDEAGITTKFGVAPTSIPDYLALVGDSADGFPGLKGWGAKATAGVLRRYPHLEDIPRIGERWEVDVRGCRSLANTLNEQRDLAFLFRDLATLRTDHTAVGTVDDWEWKGPRPEFADVCERIGATSFVARAEQLAAARS